MLISPALKKCLTSLITFLLVGFVVAQKPVGYEVLSTADGLSQGMIFDILQDKEGFVWVGTKNGLNRFDGYKFKVFTNDPFNANTISSNTILKLFEDSKGRIWVGTENSGLNIYDKKSGKFYRIQHNISNPASLSGNIIRSIEEMPNGKVLVSVAEAGLNVVELTQDFFEKSTMPLITRIDLPNNTPVYGIGKDKTGNIWVGGMDRSVYRFDPSTNVLIPFNGGTLLNNGYFTADGSILINGNLLLDDGKSVFPLFDTTVNPIGNIIFKPIDKLWEYHHREVSFYAVSKWEAGKPLLWTEKLPETTRTVYPFMVDQSGLLWSGSVGWGLRKYNIAKSKFQSHLPANSVRFIVPLGGNDVCVGDFAYGWQNIVQGSVKKTAFSKLSNLGNIDNFIITTKGDYWIKSDSKGYFKYNPAKGSLVSYPQINFYAGDGDKQPMLEDSKGIIWVPGLGGEIFRLNLSTNKIDSFSINTNPANPLVPNAICTALYEDNQGVFWIGTADGFAKVIFSTNENAAPKITWFYNNNTNRNSLNYKHVSSFLDDPKLPQSYLWIGTKGGGLNRLDKATGNFIHLTTKDGLPDEVVYGILPDDAGNIWGSTNKGIFCLSEANNASTSSWVFQNFSKANGLQDDEFNTGACAKLPNGNLAFGGVNGYNIFTPKSILVKAFKPRVFITDILINNEQISPGDKTGVLQQTIEQSKNITLNHLQDILTLEFSSLDFTTPNQNKYRYQLAGVDNNWVESGTRRTATYLHLPSGKYIFKVQGSNSQGIWSNEITELTINVLPPWWRSWWAYLLYVVLIGIAIRTYFRFTLNKAKLQSQLNYEQLEARRVKELDTIKTQLYTNITHEFRTPLTVILGMAQQIKNKPVEHLQNGMDMIIRNGQSLLNLVNEMLDLSKLETGKMQLQLVNGDVINFLRYIVESFQSLAESQKKQLHFLAEMDALYMAYDPEKIRQIVSNLLSNALKFTPERGNIYIAVSESIDPTNTDQSMLVLKVKDTGIGIPESQLQNIFDRFYQLDNSHTRKTEGTGIGLALTRELVKLMDGEITVKSPPVGANKGSEFTIMLPFKKWPATENLPIENIKNATIVEEFIGVKTNIKPQKYQEDKPLILLVEDNADVVAYTASCLPDYRLAVGNDGREGFEIATELIPDLIITDVMMPFVDGYELCRQLRADEHTSHIPIIMLTAKADIDSKMEGLQQGADEYLVKPFNREELLLRIKKLMEMRKHLQQYYFKMAGLTQNTTPVSNLINTTIETHKTEDDFVKKVRQFVEAHVADSNFSVEQLAKLVYMSHSQLNRKLEALTGCSPNKFIRIIRLNKAKTLLQNPDFSIATIALDCGYSDPGYFSRIFKQENNCSPQEWRQKNMHSI